VTPLAAAAVARRAAALNDQSLIAFTPRSLRRRAHSALPRYPLYLPISFDRCQLAALELPKRSSFNDVTFLLSGIFQRVNPV